MKLVIGDKAWSTWSLRPWLALKRAGLAFEEVQIRLRRDDTADQIAPLSPSGKVPALADGELILWDSLAICEYLAEKSPGLWPADPVARALARSAAAEMHSGFQALRSECAMALEAEPVIQELSEAAQKDVRRIVVLWTTLRTQFSDRGPFLVGEWSIADAFFTPVATRFRSYRIDLSIFGDNGTAQVYADTLLSTPEFLAWEAAARAEKA